MKTFIYKTRIFLNRFARIHQPLTVLLIIYALTKNSEWLYAMFMVCLIMANLWVGIRTTEINKSISRYDAVEAYPQDVTDLKKERFWIKLLALLNYSLVYFTWTYDSLSKTFAPWLVVAIYLPAIVYTAMSFYLVFKLDRS